MSVDSSVVVVYMCAVPERWLVNRSQEGGLWQLATAYRNHGHHKANLDPLGLKSTAALPYPLSPSSCGLDEGDRSRQYNTEGLLFAFHKPVAKLEEVVHYLEEMYCNTLSLEVAHIGVSLCRFVKLGILIDVYSVLRL